MRHTNIVFVLLLTMAQLYVVGYVSAQEFPNYSVHVVLNEQTGTGSTFPVLMELPAKSIFRASPPSEFTSGIRCLYALSIGDVRKDLEISEKQEEKIVELRADLEIEYTVARQKAFEKLIESLPPSERAKARKVIGDPIEGSFAKPAK